MLSLWAADPLTGVRLDAQVEFLSWNLTIIDPWSPPSFEVTIETESLVGRWVAAKIGRREPVGIHSLQPDGTPDLTGIVIKATRSRSIEEGDTVDTITLFGVDDQIRLSWALVYPDPTTGPPWAASSHYVALGTTIAARLLDIVDVNLGPSALTSRQLPRIALGALPTEQGAPTYPLRSRLETVAEAASRYGSTWGTLDVVDDGGFITVSPRPFRDLTTVIEVSADLGTLPSFETTWEASPASHLLTGGPGEGIDRTFGEASEIYPWGGLRREQFLDQRNSEAGELDDEAEAWLIENGEIDGLLLEEFDPAHLAAPVLVGDVVSLHIADTVVPRRITASTTTVDADGVSSSIALGGTPLPGSTLWKQLTATSTRLSLTERK